MIMKNLTAVLTTILISLALTLASIPDAEARRFGSARSFGGKSSFGSPFRRSSTAKPTRSANQKKAYNQNQTARQAMGRRGGLMGMLGGLALGGLLGAMFFGGAFEGFNFMDMLIFGGVAYLLYKIFTARSGFRRQTANSYDSHQESDDDLQYKEDSFNTTSQQRSASFDTDILFDKNTPKAVNDITSHDDAEFEEDRVATGFDEADFLIGAKGAFKDLQKFWDNRDLAEIRALTTDKVFAEIQQQLETSEEQNKTDVLKLDAELLSVRQIGTELEAVVYFDAIIRESHENQAEQVREVWHFMKSKKSRQPKWYLDGIQQLEQ